MPTNENHTRVLNPHFLRVTPIDYSLGESDMFGTGLYYESMDDYYLVTNRHIVRHEYGVSPDKIRIKYRAEDSVERVKPRLACREDSELVQTALPLEFTAVRVSFHLVPQSTIPDKTRYRY